MNTSAVDTLAFIDVDGTRYYRAPNGDFVLKDGRLVDLNTEANLRATLNVQCPQCGGSKREPWRRWPACVLCNPQPA